MAERAERRFDWLNTRRQYTKVVATVCGHRFIARKSAHVSCGTNAPVLISVRSAGDVIPSIRARDNLITKDKS